MLVVDELCDRSEHYAVRFEILLNGSVHKLFLIQLLLFELFEETVGIEGKTAVHMFEELAPLCFMCLVGHGFAESRL